MANVVEVILKARDDVSGELEKAGKNVKSFNTDILAIGATAGAISVGAGAIFKGFIDASAESEVAVKRLETRLKSTGGVAGMSMAALTDLADSLQDVTDSSDETIMRAEDLMLTFTKVGSEVFPESIEVALDMASVMGGDVKESVLRLGKALNDPIRGAAALREVGVSLTDQQLEQIKALAANNDLLGAQRIILDELATEFGGAARSEAETFTGMLSQLWNQIKEVQEVIGESGLMGDIKALVGMLISGVKAVRGFLEEHKWLANAIGTVVGIIAGGAGLVAALAAVIGMAGPLGAAFTIMTGPIGLVAAAIAAAIVIGLKFRAEIGWAFAKAADAVLMAVEKIVAGVSWVLEKMGIHWLDGALGAIQNLRAEISGWGDDLLDAKRAAEAAADAAKNIGAPAIAGTGGAASGGLTAPGATTGSLGKLGGMEHTAADMALGVTPEQQDETVDKWDELCLRIYEVSQGNFETLAADVGNIMNGIADGFGDAMVSMAVYGKSFAESFKNTFKSLIASLLGELSKLIARLLVAAVLKSFVFGGSIPNIAAVGINIGSGGAFSTSLTPSWESGSSGLQRAGGVFGSDINVNVSTMDADSFRVALANPRVQRELRRALGAA